MTTMMTHMTVEEAINRMFTCATAERCAREEACFRVVIEMKKRLEEDRLDQALKDSQEDALAAQATPAHVGDYAPAWPMMPHWETGRMEFLDWSAA